MMTSLRKTRRSTTKLMTSSATLFCVILSVLCETVKASEQNQSIRGVQDETLSQAHDSLSSFVRLVNTPLTLRQRGRVTVEYYCEASSVVVLDLTLMLVNEDSYFTVFTKAWRCSGQEGIGQPKTKTIKLRLPDPLVYRPDYFNKGRPLWLVSWAKLRTWLVDDVTWSREQGTDLYASTRFRDVRKITVLPPYSLPYKKPACTVWIWPYVQTQYAFSDTQICAKEEEYVTLLDYPAVFSGYAYSIIRDFKPFTDPLLERERLHKRFFPQMTVEMWVYILDYCPMHHLSPADACGLFIHIDRQGNIMTPAILINKDGNVQIDVKGTSGFIAMKSTDVVPKNTWTRILFTIHYRTWILHVNYGPDLSDGFWTTHTCHEDIYLDDTDGMMSIGGIDWTMGSFVGYMGRVTYHRQRVLALEQLSRPSRYHPMFELHLARRQEKCDNFLAWMDSAVGVYQKYGRYRLDLREDICLHEAARFFTKFLRDPADVTTCPPSKPFNLRNHQQVARLLQRAVRTHSLSRNFLDGDLEAYSNSFSTERQSALHDISMGLIDRATSLVSEKGLKRPAKVVHLLKQAACLGNDDAMFSLAVMLNNGVGGALDELQSLAFFMLGTLNRHSFSIMALGHRHTMGIDGAPVDNDVAYMYFKQVADQTRQDKEAHDESGIATESIRLIDEASIDAQTSEVGDLFLWLKNQAERGVQSAQAEFGALLYHGAQGVKRNLQNAINVFRDGAEMGNADSMYSYGIMQYRGLGAEVNKTEGRRMLERAAELKNPDAVSALGWMALQEQNMSYAYQMFYRAKTMGHVDSGYYLGFMHHFGLIPNTSADLNIALEEYLWSAKKGQIDAGNVYAFMLSRGTPRYKRDIKNAVEWARFIAEKNALLAKPLRNALNAYRDGNYDLSLFYYLLLADTGLEVASFNLAYLCEHNSEGVSSFISKDCQWRHYNLSTQREFHFVDAYSYIKMGDYYWYGCRGQRNIDEAAKHYALAALKGNPHALFNLAFMVEEGAKISYLTWLKLGIKPKVIKHNVSLLLDLYARCRESKESEAFLPCCLAWFRIWCLDMWDQYHLHMKITSVVGVVIVLVTSVFLLYNFIIQLRIDRQEEERRRQAEEEEREGERSAQEEIQEI